MPASRNDILNSRLSSLRIERSVRQVSPTVLSVRGRPSELQPPGSVAITVAPAGSRVLSDLIGAVRGGDYDAVEKIFGTIKTALAKRSQLDVTALTEAVEGADAFVDVAYGGRSLVSTMFMVEGIPLSRAILPYVGGSLDERKFEVVEFSGTGGPGLDVLITVHEPEVEPAVTAILKRLPADADAIRIGDALAFVPTTTATPVIVAVLVATVATAVGRCHLAWATPEWEIRADPSLSALAPNLAVRRLIARREELLAQPVE